MYDELTDESVFTKLPFQKQAELITRYCNGIQEKINLSPTLTEAQRIADEHCEQFHRSCSSDVLSKAMSEYVQNLIRQRWL